MRKVNQTFYEFMVPLVKGYSTEMSLEVTSLGIQVHGGMGYIEETGAAQYYRDGGQNAKSIASQIEATEAELRKNGSANAVAVAQRLQAAREAFLDVVNFMAPGSMPLSCRPRSPPHVFTPTTC